MRLAFFLGAVAAAVICAIMPAKAAFVADIEQVGADVVITGSGSLNISGSNTPVLGGTGAGGAFLEPYYDAVQLGTAPRNVSIPLEFYGFNGSVGSGPFGSNTYDFASSSVGSLVFISHQNTYTTIGLDPNYVSGSPLASITTFENATFSSLELTPGTYTFNLPNDTFTIDIGTVISAVPLPASAPMFGAGLIALGAAGYAAKRKRAATAA